MRLKSAPCEHAWKSVLPPPKSKGGKSTKQRDEIVWCRRCGTLRSGGRYHRPDSIPKLFLV